MLTIYTVQRNIECNLFVEREASTVAGARVWIFMKTINIVKRRLNTIYLTRGLELWPEQNLDFNTNYTKNIEQRIRACRRSNRPLEF